MSKLKTITILMCVFNGEQFLDKQLESIRNQTCRPEEVIIFDDCSTDSSINIVNQFIAKYNLSSSWKININPYRKGWRLNYYDAVMECSGDYIFFCDQDDIWYPDKVSIMTEAMQNNPNILVLTGFFDIIDVNGCPVKDMDWTKKNINNRKIIKSKSGESMFVWKQRLGCTMAIQKTLKEKLKYFKRDENFAHDIWSLNIGSLLDGCYHINHPVIQYRVHDENATARHTSKSLDKAERTLELENKKKYLEYIFDGVSLMNNELINQNEYSFLLKALDFYKFKLNTIRNFKLINVFRLIPYIKYYISFFTFRQFLLDFLEILNLRDFVRIFKRLKKS